MKEKKQISKNVWKMVSIAFVVIFLLILVGGLIRAHSFNSSFSASTPEHVNFAKAVVGKELQNEGDNLTNYEVNVAHRIRKFNRGDHSKSTIQVSLFKNATAHSYLIDVNSSQIIMHSKTEFFNWMNDSNARQRSVAEGDRWFHQGFRKRLFSEWSW